MKSYSRGQTFGAREEWICPPSPSRWLQPHTSTVLPKLFASSKFQAINHGSPYPPPNTASEHASNSFTILSTLTMSSAGPPLTMEAAVLATSLATAVVFGLRVREPPSIFRMAMKTTATALLSTLVLLRDGSWTLSGALALGALGDAFLAWNDGDTAFLGGLSSFLVAHLLYIAVFLGIGDGVAQMQSDLWRMLLAGIMLIAAPAINSTLVPRVSGGLQVPVMAYSAVIVCMTLSALTIDNSWVVWGALLFATSDAILAAERFLVSTTSSHRSWMQYAVWFLYYSGQFLITMGLST